MYISKFKAAMKDWQMNPFIKCDLMLTWYIGLQIRKKEYIFFQQSSYYYIIGTKLYQATITTLALYPRKFLYTNHVHQKVKGLELRERKTQFYPIGRSETNKYSSPTTHLFIKFRILTLCISEGNNQEVNTTYQVIHFGTEGTIRSRR